MGLAKQEREMTARGEGPLGKARDDEPVFILRAQDRTMGPTLHVWIDANESFLGTDHPKIIEAKALLDKVGYWQGTHGSRYPD
jgi:hypothetical protein